MVIINLPSLFDNREKLGGDIRYKPIGLTFDKQYVYKKGGKPVIYKNKLIAKEMLKESNWWRIVSFDLMDDRNIIDWTHEREWRVKNNFEFELSEAILVIPRKENYKPIIEILGYSIIKELGGIVILDTILS